MPTPEPINARGPFTPLGVSRSPPAVIAAVAEALSAFVPIDDLQQALSEVAAETTGAEAATLVHCAAAGITLAVAAAMTGEDADLVAQLPDTRGLRRRVVIPGPHAIDYGHPILTDIRLAGAEPVIAGRIDRCGPDDLRAALAGPDCGALLLVTSRLVRGDAPDLATAVGLGRAAGAVVIVDAAAQDLRMRELARCGADLVVISAQKYLAGPTAGLVLGCAPWVRAVAAQQRGIGRAMKPTKEALAGTIAALRERAALDLDSWRTHQHLKAQRLVASLPSWPGVTVTAAPDPTGLPFERVRLQLGQEAQLGARALAERLRAGTPPVWVIDQHADRGELLLELVPLRDPEIDMLARALRAELGG